MTFNDAENMKSKVERRWPWIELWKSSFSSSSQLSAFNLKEKKQDKKEKVLFNARRSQSTFIFVKASLHCVREQLAEVKHCDKFQSLRNKQTAFSCRKIYILIFPRFLQLSYVFVADISEVKLDVLSSTWSNKLFKLKRFTNTIHWTVNRIRIWRGLGRWQTISSILEISERVKVRHWNSERFKMIETTRALVWFCGDLPRGRALSILLAEIMGIIYNFVIANCIYVVFTTAHPQTVLARRSDGQDKVAAVKHDRRVELESRLFRKMSETCVGYEKQSCWKHWREPNFEEAIKSCTYVFDSFFHSLHSGNGR